MVEVERECVTGKDEVGEKQEKWCIRMGGRVMLGKELSRVREIRLLLVWRDLVKLDLEWWRVYGKYKVQEDGKMEAEEGQTGWVYEI